MHCSLTACTARSHAAAACCDTPPDCCWLPVQRALLPPPPHTHTAACSTAARHCRTCCQALDLLGERGTEQHRLALARGRHVLALHDAPARVCATAGVGSVRSSTVRRAQKRPSRARPGQPAAAACTISATGTPHPPTHTHTHTHQTKNTTRAPDLWLEAHVQHAVGLVQREVARAGQRHAAALNQVRQAAGRGHEDVAAALAPPPLWVGGGWGGGGASSASVAGSSRDSAVRPPGPDTRAPLHVM
jgi:hypothetical protein